LSELSNVSKKDSAGHAPDATGKFLTAACRPSRGPTVCESCQSALEQVDDDDSGHSHVAERSGYADAQPGASRASLQTVWAQPVFAAEQKMPALPESAVGGTGLAAGLVRARGTASNATQFFP